MYHIIVVCKYRKNLLIKYGDDAKNVFQEISNASDFSIVEMEVDKNHLHCLVKSEPSISPLAIVRRVKQESTHRIWLTYEKELKRHFWRERTFWSDGYFICSIGNVSKETIQHYIQQQG